MPLEFAVTWDYRCPFARNAHDHILLALDHGADWQVEFVPFSLGQVHVTEGETDVWDEPERDSGLVALQAGVAVRDSQPDRFRDAHRALFDLRHVHGRHLRDPDAVGDALRGAGVDTAAVFAEIATGTPLETVRKEHEAAVTNHEVWGVPTFIAGPHAAFARLMHPADDDAAASQRTIERVVALLEGWPALNELKHTSLSH